jgi:hypothetical protein
MKTIKMKEKDMAITFYPHGEEGGSSLLERIELLMDFAQRYRAVILDGEVKTVQAVDASGKEPKRITPKDQGVVFNWELIAKVLREAREYPEASKTDRTAKADCLTKLAEVYDVLRAARMSKLEAVRIALMTEASHLRGGDTGSVTSSSRVA